MRIEKIILNNFRIYKGKNTIIFTHDEKKNISLIAGKNGFGKTTFLTSLIWAFYGGLMSQVEEKYKKEIKSFGGYDKYLKSLINKDVSTSFHENKIKNVSFYVEVHLTDVLIPSIPCKKVVIKRRFNLNENNENLNILIDGYENELTKEVGYDLFINDFILPREIAKFFFFDAEKIVGLAEAKSKIELKSLSKAYSEVLGIKKYEDLKHSLSALLTKLRRNGVTKFEKSKLDALITTELDYKTLTNYKNNQLSLIRDEIETIKLKSDSLQEQLIREGNHISLDELKELKKEKDFLSVRHKNSKLEIKKILEFYPIVLSSSKYTDFIKKLKNENDNKNENFFNLKLEEELTNFKSELLSNIKNKSYYNEFNEVLEKILISKFQKKNISKPEKIILDYDDIKVRKILSDYTFIKDSFLNYFNQLVKTEKEYRTSYFRAVQKIKIAEARKDNPLSKTLRKEILQFDSKIELLQNEINKIHVELAEINNKRSTNQKVLSEYEKNFSIQEADLKKYELAKKLIQKIELLIINVKKEKKYSLQKSILLGLKRLMHKNNLIKDVKVIIDNDIMDINLIDSNNKIIDKDILSKGEQQLYATALLKSLVDESGIDFPVFIDSPLQKFDKEHSMNVINQFYPNVSKQVVLFPLLEKELTKREFDEMIPNLNCVFLIKNSKNISKIEPSPINMLFENFNNYSNVQTNKN